jgi:hypothetical protein
MCKNKAGILTAEKPGDLISIPGVILDLARKARI